MLDVLLIQPPLWKSLSPSVRLGIMKSQICKKGIDCKIIYANKLFRDMIPNDIIDCFETPFRYYKTAEYIFALAAFPKIHKKLKKFEINLRKSDNVSYQKHKNAQKKVPAFIKKISERIINHEPKIVYINNFFKQINATIALSIAIKRIRPGTIIAMGGYSSYSPMGEKIQKLSEAIDYVFEGEPEIEFPNFCKKYIMAGNLPKANLIDCGIINDLDSLPIPDHTDYFESNEIILKEKILTMEFSRGCRWGEKSRCIFCGEHPKAVKYRCKTKPTALKEFLHLIEKYKPDYINIRDPILPDIFTNGIAKEMIKPEGVLNIFVELKSDVGYTELYYLHKWGVTHFQAGLETMNDALLKILKKGITVAENIRFLRDCKDNGLQPSWNFLFGIPGEKECHYREMIGLIPKLAHFQPPCKMLSIFFQRHSRLVDNCHDFNIRINPIVEHKYFFPDSDKECAAKTSLFFNPEFKNNNKQVHGIIDEVSLKISSWQKIWEVSRPILELRMFKEDNPYIYDTRGFHNNIKKMINNVQHNLLIHLLTPRLKKEMLLNESNSETNRQILELVELGYVVDTGNELVSVVNGLHNRI